MHAHGPSCLRGPVSRGRGCWTTPGPKDVLQPSDERPIRVGLVERIRREIAEGSYDTPEKLEIALDRLMRRLDEE